MKKFIFAIAISLIAGVSHAATWSDRIQLKAVQADQDHNYDPVLTFDGEIANSTCTYKQYGRIIKDSTLIYKDLLSIAMTALASGKNVVILHDNANCAPRGYVNVLGVIIEK